MRALYDLLVPRVEPNKAGSLEPLRAVTQPNRTEDTMSNDRSATNNALRQQLRKASEQSRSQPAWAKRSMPAITASFSKARQANPQHRPWTGSSRIRFCCVRSLNITYNLTGMLTAAGFHGWKWCIGKTAREVGTHMLAVLDGMNTDPEKWRAMNPPNGWGDYDQCLQGRMRAWAEVAAASNNSGDQIGGWL